MSAISRLGYLGFEVSDVSAWETFATQVLGLAIGEKRDDGSVTLRMDDCVHRIVLHPGESDDLLYAGFEVDDPDALRDLVRKLEAEGIDVREAPAALAEARGGAQLFQLEDPNGVPVELCSRMRRGKAFHSELVGSGFVTGDEGLGHFVIGARDADATNHFYQDLLGFRLSDWIETELAPGLKLQLTFLHANPRHHTLAFAVAPLPKRIHHFMIEVSAMADVGYAYDRCLDASVPIANTLGQHPNDHMFSFYAKTPSGFDVEFGWGGRKVDDASWKVETYDRLSTWGHRPPEPAGGA
jgi:2,3-dihydroxybiphenyl 1,2-dioxygenase